VTIFGPASATGLFQRLKRDICLFLVVRKYELRMRAPLLFVSTVLTLNSELRVEFVCWVGPEGAVLSTNPDAASTATNGAESEEHSKSRESRERGLPVSVRCFNS